MTRLLTDQFEMIHTCNHPLWRGSIPHRLIEAGGMSLEDLDDEIARGEALERWRERLPDIMTKISTPTFRLCGATGLSWWHAGGCNAERWRARIAADIAR